MKVIEVKVEPIVTIVSFSGIEGHYQIHMLIYLRSSIDANVISYNSLLFDKTGIAQRFLS